MNPNSVSPRFVFLGEPVESVQTGPDRFMDVVANPIGEGRLTAAEAGRQVYITLPGHEDAFPTSMPWPGPGLQRIEIAPAVLEAVERADPNQDDNFLRSLRRQVVSFLDGRR